MSRMLLVLLFLGSIGLVRAEDRTAPDSGAVAQATDGNRLAAFSELKYRTLEAEARIETRLHPARDGAGIYLGDAAATLELQRFSLSIDGGTPATILLDQADAHILAGTGDMLWLKDLRLTPGPHDLHAEMQASEPAATDHAAQSFVLDAHVEAGADTASAVEFRLVPAALLSAPHLVLIEHHGDDGQQGWLMRTVHRIAGAGNGEAHYAPGRANDPAIRHVQHLARMGQADAAAVELLRMSQAATDPDTLPAEFWLRVSAALRLAGLPDQALAVCERLDAQQVERPAVGVERLRIGIAYYGAGDVAKAETQLLAAQGRLPEDRIQDWQVAYAQILFGRNQYAEARKVLQSGNVDSIDAYRYMNDSMEAVKTSAYRRFNLAVAMVQTGDEQKGLSLLDLVGRLRTSDGDLLVLRDKANLTLGWHFLQAKQGVTAMGIFGRVRSEGRYAATALLGMGWAELAPAGDKLRRARLADDLDAGTDPLPASLKNSLTRLGVLEPELRGEVGPRNFTHERPATDHEDGLRRALRFWNVLAQRDSREAPVQEGLLAIAYAFDSLNDSPHAQDAYNRAIAALESRKTEIAGHADFVRAGGLSHALSAAGGEPELDRAMENLHLQPADTSRDLYAGVDRYRALAQLEHRLHDYQAEIAAKDLDGVAARTALPDVAALLAALASAQQSEADDFQSLAQADLEHQRRGIDDYLKIAYFAAARAADNTLASR